jgi:hypothetical protein
VCPPVLVCPNSRIIQIARLRVAPETPEFPTGLPRFFIGATCGRWHLFTVRTHDTRGTTKKKRSAASSLKVSQTPSVLRIEALYHALVEAKEHAAATREEINSLKCTPNGMIRLQEIAHNLIEEFNSDLRRQCAQNMKIIEAKGLNDINYIFDLVADTLWLHYSRPDRKDSNELMDILRGELRQFLELWNELAKRKANLPKLFFITLTSEGIFEQQLWENHRKKYELVVDKAKKFKKQCVSHRTLIKPMTELRPELLSEAEYAYARILPFLDNLIHEKERNEMERKYGKPGGHARKQSHVWLPILKGLENELDSYFATAKHWERPGGVPGKAIPAEVYESINKLLHFFYPIYWDFNPKTTASIKSRCQRAMAPASNS